MRRPRDAFDLVFLFSGMSALTDLLIHVITLACSCPNGSVRPLKRFRRKLEAHDAD